MDGAAGGAGDDVFVEKKGGALRLIVDARRANRRFREPPGVVLAGPEALGGLRVAEGTEAWLATADVENCFHRMKIGEALGRYFAFPPLLRRR